MCDSATNSTRKYLWYRDFVKQVLDNLTTERACRLLGALSGPQRCAGQLCTGQRMRMAFEPIRGPGGTFA
jgi:hypothetical protein